MEAELAEKAGGAADILLVTGSEALTQVVLKLFEYQGETVQLVPTLDAYIKTLAHRPHSYRLVVLDAALARGKSADKLRDLQVDGTPFVVLGSNSDLNRLRPFLSPLTTFLSKPFRPSRLLDVTRKR